jgi:hypothetical protein
MPERHCTRCEAPGPFYQGVRRRFVCIPCDKAASHQYYHTTKARRLARLQVRLAAGGVLTRREQLQVLRATCPPGWKVCTYCLQARTLGWFGHSTPAKDGRRSQCRQCSRELTAFYDHRRKGARHGAVCVAA